MIDISILHYCLHICICLCVWVLPWLLGAMVELPFFPMVQARFGSFGSWCRSNAGWFRGVPWCSGLFFPPSREECFALWYSTAQGTKREHHVEFRFSWTLGVLTTADLPSEPLDPEVDLCWLWSDRVGCNIHYIPHIFILYIGYPIYPIYAYVCPTISQCSFPRILIVNGPSSRR